MTIAQLKVQICGLEIESSEYRHRWMKECQYSSALIKEGAEPTICESQVPDWVDSSPYRRYHDSRMHPFSFKLQSLNSNATYRLANSVFTMKSMLVVTEGSFKILDSCSTMDVGYSEFPILAIPWHLVRLLLCLCMVSNVRQTGEHCLLHGI